jgi:hypothetical protein
VVGSEVDTFLNRRIEMSNGGTYSEEYDLYWKDGVDHGCLEEDITDILGQVVSTYRDNEGSSYNVTITSACREYDGSSLHDEGLAIDIRTVDLTGGGSGQMAQDIAEALDVELGGGYDIVLHDNSGWHIHVEYHPT